MKISAGLDTGNYRKVPGMSMRHDLALVLDCNNPDQGREVPPICTIRFPGTQFTCEAPLEG